MNKIKASKKSAQPVNPVPRSLTIENSDSEKSQDLLVRRLRRGSIEDALAAAERRYSLFLPDRPTALAQARRTLESLDFTLEETVAWLESHSRLGVNGSGLFPGLVETLQRSQDQ